MPRGDWSPKRERQYEHIKESEIDAGRSKETAEEIAARTVNKQRAKAKETRGSDTDRRARRSVGRPSVGG